MKIYFAHSSDINYSEIYGVLESKLGKHEWILPHKNKVVNSKQVISTCDLFIAEVSFPSTGMGIEIGWANATGIPIVFVYRKGSKISSSLKLMSDKFIEYDNLTDLIKKLEKVRKPLRE